MRSRSPVQPLGPADEDAALAICHRDPDAHVFVAARILEGALRTQPGSLLGLVDRDAPLGYRSLVWAGANVVPVELDEDQVPAVVGRLRRRSRWASSLFGPAGPVAALWSGLTPTWGTPRAIRAVQPLLSTSTPPSRLGITPDPRVRPARPQEVDAVVPAAAAMFTDEIGYPPYSGSSAAYRRSVAALVEQGRTFVMMQGSQVAFKADVGSVALGVAQVQGVWLAPALRGQGLAVPLMAAVVEAVLADTARTVSLYVNDFNAPARATYDRIGMRQVGEFSTVLL
ncbi:acetyltransferase [Arsenicicoccus sp. oral taxon 190]|nr:acetyltransferase [Arsenicicoccus sp. oral taxon 190]